MSKKKKKNEDSKKWERVVVDEIFDEGPVSTARLLRSKRLDGVPDNSLGIDTWGEETEDFISTWRMEAFVGYPSQKRLAEGDVFFLKDGSKLTKDYEPIVRQLAAKIHLLVPWEDSRNLARQEIKAEFCKLTAASLTQGNQEQRKKLTNLVEKKFEKLHEMSVLKKGEAS